MTEFLVYFVFFIFYSPFMMPFLISFGAVLLFDLLFGILLGMIIQATYKDSNSNGLEIARLLASKRADSVDEKLESLLN